MWRKMCPLYIAYCLIWYFNGDVVILCGLTNMMWWGLRWRAQYYGDKRLHVMRPIWCMMDDCCEEEDVPHYIWCIVKYVAMGFEKAHQILWYAWYNMMGLNTVIGVMQWSWRCCAQYDGDTIWWDVSPYLWWWMGVVLKKWPEEKGWGVVGVNSIL